MLVTIDTPATRQQLMKILVAGAPPVSVVRMLQDKFENLAHGASYVLLENGQPLGAAGFGRIEEPSAASRAIAGDRPVFVLWFLATPHLWRHVRKIAARARAEMRAIRDAGGCVLADIDTNFSSASRLARFCGLLPRAEVEGHFLWEFTDAPFERDQSHGRSDRRPLRQQESTPAGSDRPAERESGAGGDEDAAE